MKAKSIQYSIPDPCEKNWNEMIPETAGRFCGSCEKLVVDFTNMPDFSIVNYLENNKHQSVCGRFGEDQLAKSYFFAKPHPSVFSFDLKAVALGLALSTFSALPSQAQTSIPVEQHDSIQVPKTIIQGAVAMSYDHNNEKFVTGKVKLNSKRVSEIKVALVDGDAVELSTIEIPKNGVFKIPLDWTKNPASIRISASGYQTETVYFSNHRSLENLTVTLHERPMKMGKVVSDR